MGKDRTGPRPLQELSNWNVSVKECDARLANSVLPGTLCYVRKRDGPRGSNLGTISKYRWGRACRMEKRTAIFQDPWKLHNEIGVYADFKPVELQPDESALGHLGIAAGELPKMAMPQREDRDPPEGVHVVQLDEVVTDNITVLPGSLTASGKNPTPGVMFIDKSGRILEPEGENHVLRPTRDKVELKKGQSTVDRQNERNVRESTAGTVPPSVIQRQHRNSPALDLPLDLRLIYLDFGA